MDLDEWPADGFLHDLFDLHVLVRTRAAVLVADVNLVEVGGRAHVDGEFGAGMSVHTFDGVDLPAADGDAIEPGSSRPCRPSAGGGAARCSRAGATGRASGVSTGWTSRGRAAGGAGALAFLLQPLQTILIGLASGRSRLNFGLRIGAGPVSVAAELRRLSGLYG